MQLISIPARPVKRPIINSAVEYATFSEIITNNFLIGLFPDRTTRKTHNTTNKNEAFSGKSFPSMENFSFSSNGYIAGGISILETVRQSKGFLWSFEIIEIGVCGSCSWWKEAWREYANLRSLVPNPNSLFHWSELPEFSIDDYREPKQFKPKTLNSCIRYNNLKCKNRK